jgi:LPXTG-motif cell wall-anchored protein
MRTRLRLGAAASVGLGVLLLATVLASPALAWHSNVTVTARCLEGQVRVHYTVVAWDKDHEATVDVSYELNGTVTKLESEEHFFGPNHNQFSDKFDLPAGTTGTITFTAVAHWKGAEASTDTGSAELPPASKCEASTTTTTVAGSTTTTTVKETTTTLEATTTTETEATVAPSSSLATTTTETAVGAATSTTPGGGALPFTGASSGPMLLAGLVLVGGGALVLFVSRNRSQTR